MYTLIQVLENAESFLWSDALYLPEDEEWDSETKCLILDPDDVEDDDEVPLLAKINNCIYVLGMHDIQSIKNNAYEQKKNITSKELIEAFLFYYDNDAYIEF